MARNASIIKENCKYTWCLIYFAASRVYISILWENFSLNTSVIIIIIFLHKGKHDQSELD